MKAMLIAAMGLLASALHIEGAKVHQTPEEPDRSAAKAPAQRLFQLCMTNEKTDATERTAMGTYSSPGLEKALLSGKSFWNFITDPSTPYMDRMAAANRGGSMLQADELPLLWQAMAEVGSGSSGVGPPPCSAFAGWIRSPGEASRVVLGREIKVPENTLRFPVTAEERDHSPWRWQMEKALSILFTKTNMYYGDVRYPARVKAAWKWPIPSSTPHPGEVIHDSNPVEWNRVSIRSRALTEAAPHDILLFQTILKLALDEDNYYVADTAPIGDLWSWGPDHHLEELAQASQIIILQRTHRENVAAQIAFEAALSAQYNSDPASAPHAKLVKTATAILAICRWATDKSLNPWNRYYGFVQPICRIVEDAPCPPDQLRHPEDPRLDGALKTFDAWFEKQKPALEQQAAAEVPHLRSLAKELSIEIE